MEDADGALTDGRLDDAAAAYEGLLLNDPNDENALRRLCTVRLRLGLVEEALISATDLARRHPESALAHATLGKVLCDPRFEDGRTGDDGMLFLERGCRALGEALALSPAATQRILCSSFMASARARLARLAAAAENDSLRAAAASALERIVLPADVVPSPAAAEAEAETETVAIPVASLQRAATLKVTLLSGFLGAGKTTLLQHVLTAQHGWRIAVIVNDMSELNVDARFVRETPAGEENAVVEMTNGCICCTLRDDLLHELARLARMNSHDYCIVESTGVSEPLPVAQAFMHSTIDGTSLGDLAALDTMVTVVDAKNFLGDVCAGDSLQQRKLAVSVDDARDLATLMTNQVECADVIVVNKCDLVPEKRLRQLEAYFRALNRTADIIRAVRGAVPLDRIVNTGRFDMAAASTSAGWIHELMGEHESETEAYGISSHLFSRPEPFDAARLWGIVTGDPPELRGVLRSKGFVWVAQEPDFVLEWQTAGVDTDLRVSGAWSADGADTRKNEVVFIGQGIDAAAIDRLLESALAASAAGPVPPDMATMFDATRALLGTT